MSGEITQFHLTTEINGGEYTSFVMIGCKKLERLGPQDFLADGVTIKVGDPVSEINPPLEEGGE